MKVSLHDVKSTSLSEQQYSALSGAAGSFLKSEKNPGDVTTRIQHFLSVTLTVTFDSDPFFLFFYTSLSRSHLSLLNDAP